MARSAILSNAELAVGLDEKGLVHDFYFPYVGQENLTTARSLHHRIGVWIDGNFSWLDDESIWDASAKLNGDYLLANASFSNENLGIKITTEDFVDHKYNFFGRKIYITNLSDQPKIVRLFMHQVFQISPAGRSDTALYIPEKHYIYNYKGRTCLLINGCADSNESFDQYVVGSYGIEGKQGSFVDAEDGELSGNNVEHAGVDSVIRFSFKVERDSIRSVNYWVVADDNQVACEQVNQLLKTGFDERLESSKSFWQEWLEKSSETWSKLPSPSKDYFKKSLLTVKAHIDKRGGVIASCDSSIYNYGRDYYNYVWPRDGALAILPLIKLGYSDEAKSFIDFCVSTLSQDGYMLHKYQPDKAVGSTWHSQIINGQPELPIQEDETALVLIVVYEYFLNTHDEDYVRDIFDKFVIKTANFMCSYFDEETGLPHASYDLWEQKYLTTTFSTATVFKSLLCASTLAKKFGTDTLAEKWQSFAKKILDNFDAFIEPETGVLRKGFYLRPDGSLDFDNTLDVSSFYGLFRFMGDDFSLETSKNTHEAIVHQLFNQANAMGVARYPDDGYFKPEGLPSNAWPVGTLWLAQYYINSDQVDKANELIGVVESQFVLESTLPEQISSQDGSAVSVTPLVWSHAEYLNTILALANKNG